MGMTDTRKAELLDRIIKRIVSEGPISKIIYSLEEAGNGGPFSEMDLNTVLDDVFFQTDDILLSELRELFKPHIALKLEELWED